MAKMRPTEFGQGRKKPQAFRPAAFRIEQMSILRNGDLARFNVLCFRQSQSDEALLDCSGDLAGVDRWIELKCALIVLRTQFMMNQGPFHSGKRTAPDD